MKRPEDKPRNFHYVITEEDILEILMKRFVERDRVIKYAIPSIHWG